MEKAEIRKNILALRNAMSGEDRRELSAIIGKRLFSLKDYADADSIFFFAGFGSEVDTLPMIDAALKDKKFVALPRVVDEKTMVFHYIEDVSELKPGYKGIPEPSEKLPMALSEPELIIVPGAAFDREMNRIGYGRGYYDRFFKTVPLYVPKVALCFSLQLTESIPYEALDETMDMIITENETIVRPEYGEN